MSGKVKNLIIAAVVLLGAGVVINQGCSGSREVVTEEDAMPEKVQAVQSAHEEMMMRGRANRRGAVSQDQPGN